jgi:hypothetical protein
MKIEKIIYETTRNLLNLEDKLAIAKIFLFCEKLGSKKIAELIYTNDPEKFINDLEQEYIDYEIDLKIRFDNRDVKNAFNFTTDMYITANDYDGFLKAVYENDPYALAICEITNTYFDKMEAEHFAKNLKKLELK